MMFGALSRCPECLGKMKFQLQGSYWCQGGGFFGKDHFRTRKPGRHTELWSLGKACSNYYLLQWHHNQSTKKTLRGAMLILPGHPADSISEGTSTRVGRDWLWNCMFVTIGKLSVTQATLKQSVKAAGGTLRGGAKNIRTEKFRDWCGPFRAIVTTEEALEDERLCHYIDYSRLFMKLVGRPIPILREQFLLDCLKKQQFQRIDDYILEPPQSTEYTDALDCFESIINGT